MKRPYLIYALAAMSVFSCNSSNTESQVEAKNETDTLVNKQDSIPKPKAKKSKHEAYYVDASSITIDGEVNEAIWQKATSYPIDQRWLGEPFDSNDFKGSFKLAWNENYLYLLVDVVDDTLIDIKPDPVKEYWHDDCVEIFIDENNSDGNHQFNYNAFAYHVALDYNVADIGTDSVPHLFNDHITAKRITNGNRSTWEFAIKVFDDSFELGKNNTPVILKNDKIMGFALAYCDNDKSDTRENFIGSTEVLGEDKDQAWIDENVFGDLILKQ